MPKREIKVIKLGEVESPSVPDEITAEETASELEAERRSTVKDWIAEYRENDRIEKEDDKDQLYGWL